VSARYDTLRSRRRPSRAKREFRARRHDHHVSLGAAQVMSQPSHTQPRTDLWPCPSLRSDVAIPAASTVLFTALVRVRGSSYDAYVDTPAHPHLPSCTRQYPLLTYLYLVTRRLSAFLRMPTTTILCNLLNMLTVRPNHTSHTR
jgi:hypothetical protein